MTALYLERYLNFGLTRGELQSGRPIVGIAQSGSDLSPCNRHHLDLAKRVADGIRESGGIPLEFPVHPIQETGRRPTAALDRNLCTLGLIEILRGYPLDGVVLMTGCDKTTPAQLMAAATVDLPAIVLSGGPMLNGYYRGRPVGSGTVIWERRRQLAQGEITQEDFMESAAASAPSIGHCNTMGTALTMNCLAEAMGMSLPGCASIPAPYRERGQMAFETGRQIVKLVRADLRPSMILTRQAFENAIVMCAALGGSTNAPSHIIAIAAHIGVRLTLGDWHEIGRSVPQLVDCQPTGQYLAEDFHRAGGVPVVARRLMEAGLLKDQALTVTGKNIFENVVGGADQTTGEVIRPASDPVFAEAGFAVLTGNLFNSAIMKMSAIGPDFRERYLSDPASPNVFEVTAIVFDGPEDYRRRINDPTLGIDERSILVMRGCGPVGYPGSAEVVNMQPPDHLLKLGIFSLPSMGDGRQSGTSDSPSILNASPEASVGGGLALLRSGDRVRIDLNLYRVDVLLSVDELERRRSEVEKTAIPAQTPWEELYCANVEQLESGAVLRGVSRFQRIGRRLPRHSH